MPERRQRSLYLWIIGLAVLVLIALAVGVNLTNEAMQEGGQPPPEQLQEESGNVPAPTPGTTED